MLYDGTIRITLLEISARDGLIGISNGQGLSPLFFESDFDQYAECSFPGDLNNDLLSNNIDFSMLSKFWMQQEVAFGNVRDEFDSLSYVGNDGMFSWSTDWQEEGESDGCTEGMICLTEDGRLRIGHENTLKVPNIMLTRQADISEATTAGLSFDYDVVNFDNKGTVHLQVSDDGGITWYTLDTFDFNSGSGAAYYDLTPYISSATQIRFLLEESKKLSIYMFVDNVQIEYDSPDVPWYPWCNGSDIDEDFSVDINDLLIFSDHWLE
jgi:hypothetical protein